jgi:hypothetical protein
MMAPVDPPDLPLLTDIVAAADQSAAIPTLTEIVPAQTPTHAPTSPGEPLAAAEAAPQQDFGSHSIAQMASKLIWNAPSDIPAMPGPVQRNISEAEIQQLADHFETHLESVFTAKLNRHLQQLHHQAVKLAISELKSELPGLLRKALDTSELKK